MKQTKQVAITAEAHERAKRQADRLGMKLYRFIELAIEAFDAGSNSAAPKPPRGKRIAG